MKKNILLKGIYFTYGACKEGVYACPNTHGMICRECEEQGWWGCTLGDVHPNYRVVVYEHDTLTKSLASFVIWQGKDLGKYQGPVGVFNLGYTDVSFEVEVQLPDGSWTTLE